CPLYPQKRTLELSRVMSALCQKRTYAVQHRRRKCVCLCRLHLSLDDDRQRECECRTLARLRLDPNPPAVHLDDALGYGESQPGAALLARDRIVGLLKLLKELGLVRR